jgi:hypothetical protein
MVSPQNTPTEIAPGTLPVDRGFVRQEASSAAWPTRAGAIDAFPTYFWGSVVAGTMLVLSLFVLSYFLMLGCHVGVAADQSVSLGVGSGVWMFITGCVAYFFGGMLSNCISRPVYSGFVKGATIWGLSIPLALLIAAILAGGTGILTGLNSPLIVSNASASMSTAAVRHVINYGVIWTTFLTLAAGLICSIIGSWSTSKDQANI